MRASFFFVVLVGIAAAWIGFACDEDFKDCYGTDYEGCTCADGGFGYAKCSPLGDYQTAVCVCNGTTPGVDARSPDVAVDAPPEAAPSTGPCVPSDVADAGDAGEAGDGGETGDAGDARKTLFEVCTTNADCETCICELFGGIGRCTRSCTTLADCPAPADACTTRGVCRPGP